MLMFKRAPLAILLLTVAPSAALAEEPDVPSRGSSTVVLAMTGELSPLLTSATVGAERALVVGEGGYDSARRGALFDSAAQVRVWGPVAFRAGVIYSDDTRRMRPNVGVRIAVLRQASSGVDASLSSFFKTEGFDEAEGEIESAVAIGHRFEKLYLLGNLAYGQDPEGNERDGEVRISALRSQGRGVWGIEGRGRSAIGAQHSMSSALEPRLDLTSGAVGMFSINSFVVFAEVGPSALKFQGSDLRWGITSVCGVGSSF